MWGFESLRYGVLPVTASLADRAAVFMTALVAEQKFYPIFAFLFGAGFALHTRSLKRLLGDWIKVRALYRRRLWWLLGCGVLHGTLIWFGDILSLYGIAGFFIVGFAGARLRTVRVALLCWAAVWIALVIFNLFAALPLSADGELAGIATAMVKDAETARAIYTSGSFADIAVTRITDYVELMVQSVFLLPHVVVLFLLGILSVRLGWLTRPRRHAAGWRRVRGAGFALGIPFSLLWAGVALTEAIDPPGAPTYTFFVFALLPVGGTLLAAAYTASVMLANEAVGRWLARWLAPAGRMALTNYLSQSVLCALLLQGVGLGLGAGLSHGGLLAVAAAIMIFQVLVSRWWLRRFRQGPVETIYRRQTVD
jgi:uncharacterized protein